MMISTSLAGPLVTQTQMHSACAQPCTAHQPLAPAMSCRNSFSISLMKRAGVWAWKLSQHALCALPAGLPSQAHLLLSADHIVITWL
jgi:hypothetical protein